MNKICESQENNCRFKTIFHKRTWFSLKAIILGILASWVIGALDLSFAWLLLLIIGLIYWLRNFVILKTFEDVWYEEVDRLRKRRTLCDGESAEWINLLLNQWIQMNGLHLTQIVKRLERAINSCKPAFIEKLEIVDVKLGERMPRIQSLRSYQSVNGKKLPLGVNIITDDNACREISCEFDIIFDSDDFRVSLQAKLCGAGIGFDVEVAFESVRFNGRGDLTLRLESTQPFPHIANGVFFFVRKPQFSFQLQVFKGVQLMEIPLIRNWLHGFFMELIEVRLVDPNYVALPNFLSNLHIEKYEADPNNLQETAATAAGAAAEGVLMVFITIDDTEEFWIEISVGCDLRRKVNSSEKVGFLVYSLERDILTVEIKQKRYMEEITGKYEMPLIKYNLKTSPTVETCLENTSNAVSVTLRLEFVPLSQLKPDVHLCGSSGVLNCIIHNAQINGDFPSPYCIVFQNNRQVFMTQCANNVNDPSWESHFQVFVKNVKDVSLLFVLFSWDGKLRRNQALIGLAEIFLANEKSVIGKKLFFTNGNGSVVVTVTFLALHSMPFQSPEKTPKREALADYQHLKVERRLKLGIPVAPPVPPPLSENFWNIKNMSHSNTDSPSARSVASSVHSGSESPNLSLQRRPKEVPFQSIRTRVSRSLRLLRFKSEGNIRDLGRETLEHAVSQPDMTDTFMPSLLSSPPSRPKDFYTLPDTYSGVEGRVIQAQGLHVAHVPTLYCRVKLICDESYKGKSKNGKVLAQSRLIPAVPNPMFHLDFQISSPAVVLRTALLLFEIKGAGKDVVASRKIALQELMSGDLRDTHTWLALNNGATLEVNIAQGRILKKQKKKMFSGWSVHGIGKI